VSGDYRKMNIEQDIQDIKTLILKIGSNSYPRWMDIKTACTYTSMSKPTIMEYIMIGDVYAKKLSGKWYVDRDSIDEFMLKDSVELTHGILKLCK